MPFDFLHNQIVVHAKVNGSGPFDFVLDTGTHVTTVDLGLARRLRLPLGVRKSEAAGAGKGRALAERTTLDALSLGDLRIQGMSAVALDLSAVSETLGRPLHGVLGFNLFISRIVRIDYFHRRIGFLAEPPSGHGGGARRITFPMEFRAGSILPVLENCLVNGVRIPVTLDTGSSLGLILFPRAIERLGLGELARDGIPLQAAGYRGKAYLKKGWVRSLVLDTIDLGAIEVAYVERGYGDGESLERRGGNLGNAILQDFVLTLDYRGRLVTLESTEP